MNNEKFDGVIFTHPWSASCHKCNIYSDICFKTTTDKFLCLICIPFTKEVKVAKCRFCLDTQLNSKVGLKSSYWACGIHYDEWVTHGEI